MGGLSDKDKAMQKAAMEVLQQITIIDEARGEKIVARLTPAVKKSWDKMYGTNPRQNPRRASGSLTKIASASKLKRSKSKNKKKINKKSKTMSNVHKSPSKKKNAKDPKSTKDSKSKSKPKT